MGGSIISPTLGAAYRAHITRYVAAGDKGRPDLVALFFRRAAGLGESLGLIATNTIAQGETRKVGLAPLVAAGQGAIFRAVTSVRWPGRDAVHVAKVWWTRREWLTAANLDECPVEWIESDFYPSGRTHGEPRSLPGRVAHAQGGQKLTGKGFILDGRARAELFSGRRQQRAGAVHLHNGKGFESESDPPLRSLGHRLWRSHASPGR